MQASSYPSTKSFFKSPTYILWGLSILMAGLFSCIGNVQADTNESALYIDEKGNLTIGTTTFIYQSGNVGIGTPSPKAKLEVSNQSPDDTAFQPLISLVANQKSESLSNTFDESKPSYGIEFFRRWNSASSPRLQAGIYAWGTENYGSGLAFRTSTNESSGLFSHMVITDKGKVGIGTTQPQSALSVAGGLAVGATYAKTNTASANDLLVEGKVGIGTKNPETRLDIDTGEIKVRASHNDLKPDIGTFLANNKSQGIGIGYNSIQAIGTNADQDINIKPKGNGKVTIDRSFLIQTEINTGEKEKKEWKYPLSPGCDDHDGCRIKMWLEPTKHGANAFRIITMDVAVSSGSAGLPTRRIHMVDKWGEALGQVTDNTNREWFSETIKVTHTKDDLVFTVKEMFHVWITIYDH